MYEEYGLTIEDVMRMPWCRFMAAQRRMHRRQIEEFNAKQRADWQARAKSREPAA
jgi:hypothetical protein